VVITNYTGMEELEGVNNPEDPSMGTRKIPFTQELYIEQADFMEIPIKGFHRLVPGGEVRLRYAYIIRCDQVIKNERGEVIELKCTLDPETRSGTGTSKKKVKGTIHWVSAEYAVNAEVILYDRLFTAESPDSDKEKGFLDYLNPNSIEILPNALVEPFLKDSKPGERFQFERNGYFCVDAKSTKKDKLVFNRTVTLKDSWGKSN